MAAGSRQQSRFMAIMNDYERTLQLVRTSTNSAGEANRQYAIYEDSVGASLNRLKNTQEAFYASITSSDAIKFLYGQFDQLLQILTGLNPTLLATVGIIGTLVSVILKFIVVSQTMKGAVAANTLAAKLFNVTALRKVAVFLKLAPAATFAAKAEITAAGATATLTAAVLIFVAVLAVLVIGFVMITKAIKDYNNRVFEAAQLAQKEADTAKETYQNLQGQINRYNELTSTINKTNEEKAELNELTAQIISDHPDLLAGITAEGQAYLENAEALKVYLIQKQKEAKDAEIAAYRAKMAALDAAAWNADLTGAPGQKTVDISTKITEKIRSYGSQPTRLGYGYNFWR